MEKLLILRYPASDLDAISRIVQENECFVGLVNGDIYGIQHYHLSSDLSNFSAILDRNVYTRICALVRGEQIPLHALDDHRWAAAVIAFCQIAELNFHYGSSLQEYASVKGGASAVAELATFHKADNCNPLAWIDFAVGRSKSLDLSSIKDLPPMKDIPQPKSFEAPTYDYRVNYIMALKLVLLSYGKDPPEKQMLKFIDWMENEFVLGSGAFLFANLLFSPARVKGMLKRRSVEDARNIAWDLALIQNWRTHALKGSKTSKPVLLITRDKVVKFIAKRLVASDTAEFRSHVVDHWKPAESKGELVFQRYLQLHKIIAGKTTKRIRPNDQKLDSLTIDFEQQVSRKLTI